MRIIVIYHSPQECGCPYFMFINAEDGQVMQTVNLPDVDGYYDGGIEFVKEYVATGRRIEQKIDSTRLPEVGEVLEWIHTSSIRTRHKYNRDGYVWVVEDFIDIKEEDFCGMHCYKARFNAVELKVVNSTKYLHRSKDSYIREMTDAGFDMTGWCQYKRRKTEYETFLHAMAKAYCKDYEIINFIRVW